MSIDKDEIEKYIFDPQNPKQCKSYNLLLILAKKKKLKSFFSPEFLQYFFAEQIINDEFNDELWDKPNNYDSLTPIEKIELFKKTNSANDLKDIVQKIDFNINRIMKFNFIDLLSNFYYKYFYTEKRTEESLMYLKEYIIDYDIYYKLDNMFTDYREDNYKEYNYNFILFSKNYLDLLKADISKASIFITLEYNIDKFLQYKQTNIKPIFLKKIEDVDILLNILEQDLSKTKNKYKKIEEISTIDKIEIKDFFSIKDLKLENLKDKKEIYILGENGDGKTLLLQAIAIALKGVQKDGQEKFREIKDKYSLTLLDSKQQKYGLDENNLHINMFAYGVNRNNNYQTKEDEVGYLTLFDNSLDLKDPIKWLQYLDYSESKNENGVISVIQAKELISNLLNKEVAIEITPSKVIFTEKGAKEVEFERLSAGYKGVITIICDMLVRLSENQPHINEIQDYQGIVLIDEIELHLHPKWKYDFMKRLREIFPLIQFIVTTHSPTVILGASKEAIFYKIYKEYGEVYISNEMKNEGYTNNSLISSPLFDLKSITSRDYKKRVNSDDYIYDKIHQVIATRIKENINIDEQEILKLIDEELDKI